MTTWKQYSAKFKDFQNMKFPELSQDAFTKIMNIYIILTFFGHYSMLTAVYCVHRTCVNAPCRGTHRIFRIQCGKNSRQHFCFKLVNLYLLYDMRNRVWRDCKQLSLNKSMFSLKTFKASRCSNVRHNSVMSVQPT